MSISTAIASVGESPNFIAFNAHCWFAFFVVVVVAEFVPLIFVLIACLIAAAIKEYWFDLKYETNPVQTVKDSTMDFLGYLSGICIGALYMVY